MSPSCRPGLGQGPERVTEIRAGGGAPQPEKDVAISFLMVTGETTLPRRLTPKVARATLAKAARKPKMNRTVGIILSRVRALHVPLHTIVST
jgi:hypothetical protein